MRIVVALGGNALLKRGQPPEADVQRANVRAAARRVAALAEKHQLIVTHGNGPQVGLLALQSEAYREVRSYPLDMLGAESEGMIGYLIDQELSSLLPERDVATLLTQVEVDPHDPAFSRPTKPIGPVYEEEQAKRLALERGWMIAPEEAGFRRVVPSPAPRRILEIGTIRLLVRSGVLVVCAGGGGIPVTVSASGEIRGVEVVVDKDRSAALLAESLAADALLLLTDVPAVYADWPDTSRLVREATPEALRALDFNGGSMGPKVDAGCRFVERTSGWAAIGTIEEADRILAGEAGTLIRRDGPAIVYGDESA
ncbi:MAG: carbamate kinase [Planctomycetota bacterium]|jgi:carbamate kinase